MLYFLIPVFNELDNLDVLCKNLQEVLPDYQKFYVFFDDGSSDGSQKKIAELLKEGSFIVLGDGTNNGPGYAFDKGFEWILQDSKNPEQDKIVTVEADNTSDLNILPIMVKNAEMGFDLVLASVYAQGGGFDKTSFFRRIISLAANLLLRFAFDLKILTLSSFYRVYTVSIIKKIKVANPKIIRETGFICMIEVLLKAVRADAKVLEIPMMLYSEKRKGKSKMKVFKTMIAYLKFLIRSKRNK
jgi:dolichol-phosphate mannosyltransferase